MMTRALSLPICRRCSRRRLNDGCRHGLSIGFTTLANARISRMADQADVIAGAGQAAVSVEASSLRDQVATIRQALKTSPVRKPLRLDVGRHRGRHCRDRRSARFCSTAGTSPSTMRWRGATWQAFLHQLLVFADNCRRAAGAQRRPDLAQPDDPAEAARGADARPDRRMDAAGARLPAGQCRRHRRQSRPAHAAGCRASVRSVDRSRRRPAAVLHPACVLRRRAVGAVLGLRLPHQAAIRWRYRATWSGRRSSMPASPRG